MHKQDLRFIRNIKKEETNMHIITTVICQMRDEIMDKLAKLKINEKERDFQECLFKDFL